ncbi:MAG TPA: hypothetical protein VKU82_09390 [Planctomycetaceae bacterium]|nr:hypothetical protein [Planctomycetaceae bacterium]
MQAMLWLWLMSLLAPGCCSVPVTVGNPIPGMTTIAIAPFFNLSAEPSVDGRRFAMAYYNELQKTANYQVMPVGVAELAIRENDLNMTSPADAVKLAQILNADAIVVGAVTEYNPYYPPQLGVQINWYTAREWIFYPGISSSGEKQGDGLNGPADDAAPPNLQGKKTIQPLARAQSADDDSSARFTPFTASPAIKLTQGQRNGGNQANNPPPVIVWPPRTESSDLPANGSPPAAAGKAGGAFCVQIEPDTVQPIMSYTRFFDGADRPLMQALRGYYILRGDLRSGGWEAYLHRSDDFLKFASHVLVIEMLTLHGGPLKTEKIFMYGR